MYGCDCYAYGLLATGTCDLVVEADMKPYDYMALVPIVTGAGGVMTDWQVCHSPMQLLLLVPSTRCSLVRRHISVRARICVDGELCTPPALSPGGVMCRAGRCTGGRQHPMSTPWMHYQVSRKDTSCNMFSPGCPIDTRSYRA